MNQNELEFIRKQLQSAIPPVNDALRVDLWPRMVRRMEEPPVTFGWFESMLVALLVAAFAIFPKLLPAMFYHL